MSYLFEALYKPTRLYIKQCPHCDLKYFGKTVSEDIESYFGSGTRWKSHLKKHKVAKPLHLWNSDWYYDTSIRIFATEFSVTNGIVESANWANLAIENGTDGGYLGEEVLKKVKETKSKISWQKSVGSLSARKISYNVKRTKSDPEWKATIGKNQGYKISAIQNDSEWKATIGRHKTEKIACTRSDPSWKENVGIPAYLKSGKNQSATKASIEWKERNNVTCEYCHKHVSKPNYVRWHGNSCKEKFS